MSDPSPREGKDDLPFHEIMPLNMAMPKPEVLGYFQEKFPHSSEAAILSAFINLRNAPDDATITFERTRDRGRDALNGRVVGADGRTIPGRILVDAVSGQPLQMIG